MMEKLFIKGTRFVNASGKEVILHGENVLCTLPSAAGRVSLTIR